VAQEDIFYLGIKALMINWATPEEAREALRSHIPPDF
jgi:hypothetical protein